MPNAFILPTDSVSQRNYIYYEESYNDHDDRFFYLPEGHSFYKAFKKSICKYEILKVNFTRNEDRMSATRIHSRISIDILTLKQYLHMYEYILWQHFQHGHTIWAFYNLKKFSKRKSLIIMVLSMRFSCYSIQVNLHVQISLILAPTIWKPFSLSVCVFFQTLALLCLQIQLPFQSHICISKI